MKSEASQRPGVTAWLASQAARLDLATPASAPAPAPALVQVSTPIVRVSTTLPLPLLLPQGSEDWLPPQRPEGFADLVPPVRYAPIPRATPATRRAHPLLALTALAVAVGTSYFLPVAGTLAVAAMVIVLRAGDKARSGLAGRRYARGRRAWDSLLIAWSAPWALARSLVDTILYAPVLLVGAAVMVTASTIWLNASHPLPDWSAVAAVYTALSCIGPRSRPVRREMNRILAAVAATPLGAAVALLTAAVLAMTVAALVLMQAPPMWPLPDPPSMIVHVSGFNLAKFHG